MKIRSLKLILLILATLPWLSFAEGQRTLIVLGDSLTEGYGVAKDLAYPSLLEKDLSGWRVINSGVSGSTSASAPGRIKWSLKSKPTAILIALGANDGLRGLSPGEMKKNLKEAIDGAQQSKVKVLLAGILAPPNYGPEYTKQFAAVFPDLAQEFKLPLYPFLLKDVAGQAKMNLPDGIHPNEAGHRKIADNLLPFLKKELP